MLRQFGRTSIASGLSLALVLTFGLLIAAALAGIERLHAANQATTDVTREWAPRLDRLRQTASPSLAHT